MGLGLAKNINGNRQSGKLILMAEWQEGESKD